MNLKTLRIKANLTLQALADKSGVHYMIIQRYESNNGKRKPENMRLTTALKLADALECEPRDLLTPDEINIEEVEFLQ
jgi:transcriptional regulator with XRE-family HTH domain